MAYNVGLKVGVQGEAEFKKGIREVNKDMKLLKSEMRGVYQEFDKGDKSLEHLTARTKNFTKQTDAQREKVSLLTKQHEKQNKELEKLANELEKTKQAHDADSKEVIKAQKAYDAKANSVKGLDSQVKVATSQLNKLEKQMMENRKELALQSSEWTKLGDKIETQGVRLQATGDKMQGVGKSMTAGITTPLAAIATASIGAFKVVDEGLDTIVKKTGATGDAAEEFGDIFDDLGSRIPADLNDVGAAIGEVNTRLGFTGDKLNKASEQFLKFARINDTDVNTSVQLVTRAMGDAGIEADDYEKILDQLTVAAQASGIGIDNLTGNLAKYGAPMRALGFDTETSIATFAGWEKAGVNTEIAFSGMKQAIGKWSKEGKNAQEEFQKTLETIKSAPDITDATGIAIEAFGQRAGSDLADAIYNGRFEVGELVTAIQGSEGAVTNTFAQVSSATDDAKAAFNRIKIAGADLGQSVLGVVVPVFETLADSVAKVGRWFKKLDPDMRKTIVRTAGLVAGIGPLIFILGRTVSKVGAVVTGIGIFAKAIGVVTTGAVAATPAIASMAGAITFLTGPIGIAIAAVSLLTVGLGALYIKQKNSTVQTKEQAKAAEEFVEKNDDMTASIKGNLEARTEAMASTEGEIHAAEELADKIFKLSEQENKSAHEKEMLATWVAELNGLMPGLNLIIDEQTGSLVNTEEATRTLIETEKERIRLASLSELMIQNSKDEYEAVQQLNKAEEELIRLKQEQQAAAEAAYDTGKSEIQMRIDSQTAWDEYNGIISETEDSVLGLTAEQKALREESELLNNHYENPEAHLAYIEGNNKIEESARTTFKSVDEIQQQHKIDAGLVAAETGEVIKTKSSEGLLGWAIEQFTQGSDASNQLAAGYGQGKDLVITTAGATKDGAVAAVAPMSGEMSAIGSSAGAGLGSALGSNASGVKTQASNVYGAVDTTMSPMVKNMATIGKDSGAQFGSELDKQKRAAKSAGLAMYLAADKAVEPLPKSMTQHGVWSGEGYRDGLKSTQDEINRGGAKVVDDLLSVFRTKLGINSPSDVLFDIGAFTTEGFLGGLMKNIDQVMGFVDNLIEDLKNAFSAGNLNLEATIDFIGSGAAEFLKSVGIGGASFKDLAIPVDGAITSGFGYRSAESTSGVGSTNHMGIDVGAAYGAQIGAAGAGTVTQAGWLGGYGNTVTIDHGQGLSTLYAHMSEILVGVGQVVKQLQAIGLVGSTGNSTGAHLHFGVMKDGAWVDPGSLWGYDVGTRYVPKTMPAMVHEGEMIVPKSENPYANSNGNIMPGGVKQPLTVQVVLNDGRILAQTVLEDINNMLGNKYGLRERGMA